MLHLFVFNCQAIWQQVEHVYLNWLVKPRTTALVGRSDHQLL